MAALRHLDDPLLVREIDDARDAVKKLRGAIRRCTDPSHFAKLVVQLEGAEHGLLQLEKKRAA